MIGSLNLPLCQSHPKLLISTVLSEHIAGIRFPSLHIYSVTTGICSDVLFLGLSSGLFCWNSSYFDFLPSKPITSAHFAPSQVSKPWLYALIFPRSERQAGFFILPVLLPLRFQRWGSGSCCTCYRPFQLPPFHYVVYYQEVKGHSSILPAFHYIRIEDNWNPLPKCTGTRQK